MKCGSGIIFFAIFFGVFLFHPIGVGAANTDIIINEINAAKQPECVEILNKGDEEVVITDKWRFFEGITLSNPDGSKHLLTATGTDAIIMPNEYAVICDKDDIGEFKKNNQIFFGSIFSSSFGLTDNGEEIGLIDAEGNFIERFNYNFVSKKLNFSLERNNPALPDYTSANWQEHASGNTLGFQNSNYLSTPQTSAPTQPDTTQPAENNSTTTENNSTSETVSSPSPEQPISTGSETSASGSEIINNQITTQPASTVSPPQTTPVNSTDIALWHSLKINEFMPNPAEGGEWVELYNPTGSNLDLKGGIICDDRTETSCKIISLDGMVASAKSFLLVRLSGSKLNNGGDAVILKTPIGTVADRVNYGGDVVPEKGESFARKIDGFDTDGDGDWTIVSKPTPGGKNGVVEVVIESSAGEEILKTAGEIKIIKDIMSVVAVEKASASEATVLKSTAKKTTTKSTVAKTGSAVSSVRLADARQLAKGKNVKIKGLITSLPGTYGTQYFYLSDEDGGIQIFQQKKDFPELALGDYVEATGVVSLANGIKRVNIKNKDGLDILSVSNPIEPNLLSFSELDDSRLGSLVKVSGEITEIKSSLMYIDDGEMELAVYFKKGAKIDKSEFSEGETVEVTGILEKTKDETQVWPRSNNDIVSVGTAAVANKEKTNEEKNTAEKYLTISAVGLSAALLGLFARAKWILVSGTARRIVGFVFKIRG